MMEADRLAYRHHAWAEYQPDFAGAVKHEATSYHQPTLLDSQSSTTTPRTYDGVAPLGPAPLQTRYLPRSGPDELGSASTSSSTPSSANTLKRSFAESNDSYGSDDIRTKLQDGQVSHGQSATLLGFKDVVANDIVLDPSGQHRSIAVSAQLSGMFLLSEGSNSEESQQPELTCYRRNLFSVTGTVQAPRGPLFLANGKGMIHALEVSVQAVESTEGHDVQLIVIPWKTTPSYAAELSAGSENEPVPVALVPYEIDRRGMPSPMEESTSYYPVVFRRLQFRQATANNGRRRELQQHFIVHLHVVATLGDGRKVKLAESTTRPIIVRGRSPRNFHKKQDIPLAGTAASRGLGPELPIVPRDVSLSSQNLERMPTSLDTSPALTELSSTALSLPYASHSSSSRSWNMSSQQAPHPSMEPAVTKLSSSLGSSYGVPPSSAGPSHGSYIPTLPSSNGPGMLPQLRTSFAYDQSLATPPTTDDGSCSTDRYPVSPQSYGPGVYHHGDGNPRPTKSPRHTLTPDTQFSPVSTHFGGHLPSSIGPVHDRQCYPRSQPAIDARLLSRATFEPSLLPSEHHAFTYVDSHPSRQSYITPAADTLWSTH